MTPKKGTKDETSRGRVLMTRQVRWRITSSATKVMRKRGRGFYIKNAWVKDKMIVLQYANAKRNLLEGSKQEGTNEEAKRLSLANGF